MMKTIQNLFQCQYVFIAILLNLIFLQTAVYGQNIRQLIDLPISGLCNNQIIVDSELIQFTQTSNQIPTLQNNGDINFSLRAFITLQSNSQTGWTRIIALKDNSNTIFYELLIKNDLSQIKMKIDSVDSSTTSLSNINGQTRLITLEFKQDSSQILLNIYNTSFAVEFTLTVPTSRTFDITTFKLLLLNIADGSTVYNVCGAIQNVLITVGKQNSGDTSDLNDILKYQGQSRLLLHYDFQQYQGSIVSDLSGLRNQGKLSSYYPPQISLSSRGILSFSDFGRLDITPFRFGYKLYSGSFTLSLQLRIQTFQDHIGLLQRQNKGNLSQVLRIDFLKNGSSQFLVNVCLSNQSDCVTTSSTKLNQNTFHRLVMVFIQNPNLSSDQQKIIFYLDETLKETLNFSSTSYAEDDSDEISIQANQGNFDISFLSIQRGSYVNKINPLVKNCQLVIGSEQSICTYCNSSYFKYEGQCISSSITVDTNNIELSQNSLTSSFVKKCDRKCKSCDSLSPSKCYTCSNNRVNNPPRCQCPDHTFDVPEISLCPSYIKNSLLEIGEVTLSKSLSQTSFRYSQRIFYKNEMKCIPIVSLSIVNIQEQYDSSSTKQSVKLFASDISSTSFQVDIFIFGPINDITIKNISSCDKNIKENGQLLWTTQNTSTERNTYYFDLPSSTQSENVILFIQEFDKNMNSQQQAFNMIACNQQTQKSVKCIITSDYYTSITIGWIGISSNLSTPSTIYTTPLISNSPIFSDNINGQKNSFTQKDLSILQYFPNNLDWFGGINTFVYNGVISYGISVILNPVMKIITQRLQIYSLTSANMQGMAGSTLFNGIRCPSYCGVCQPDEPYKCKSCNISQTQCTLDLNICSVEELISNSSNLVYCRDINGICKNITSGECSQCPQNYLLLSSGKCQKIGNLQINRSYKDYIDIYFLFGNQKKCDADCTNCQPLAQSQTGEFQCKGCREGFFLNPNDSSCVRCPLLNDQIQLCSNNCKYTCYNCLVQDILWIDNLICNKFQDTSNIIKQPAILYLKFNQKNLEIQNTIPCNVGCSTCLKNKSCLQCLSGYSLQKDGSCQKCGNNCEQCQILGQSPKTVVLCIKCKLGSTITTTDSSTCDLCKTNCATCDTYSENFKTNLIQFSLDQYDKQFNLDFDKSSFEQRCIECSDKVNQIVSSDGQTCVQIIQNCKVNSFGTLLQPMSLQNYFSKSNITAEAGVKQYCYQCADTFTLKVDKLSCVSGCSISDCLSCIENSNGKTDCLLCNNGKYYDSESQKCVNSCAQQIQDCLLCDVRQKPTIKYNQCLKCPDEVFYDEEQGQDCLDPCLLCNTFSKKCLMCKQGYYLSDNNVCLNDLTGSVDYTTQVQSNLKVKSIPTTSGCKKCPRYCTDCYEGNQFFDFTRYLTQYQNVLTQTQLINYYQLFSTSLICKKCQDGYLLNQATSTCEFMCGIGCSQCVLQQMSPSNSYPKCTSCINSYGYALSDKYKDFLNSFFTIDGQDPNIKVTIETLIKPDSNQKNCQICPLTCSTCLPFDQILSSDNGFIELQLYQNKCITCRQDIQISSTLLKQEYLINQPKIMFNSAIQRCVVSDTEKGFINKIVKDIFVSCGIRSDLIQYGNGTPSDPFIFENLLLKSKDLFFPLNDNEEEILLHQYILNEIGVQEIEIHLFFDSSGKCQSDSFSSQIKLYSSLMNNVQSLKTYNIQFNSFSVLNDSVLLQNGIVIFELKENIVFDGFNSVLIKNMQFQKNGFNVIMNISEQSVKNNKILNLSLDTVTFLYSSSSNQNVLIYLSTQPINMSFTNVSIQRKTQSIQPLIQTGQDKNGYETTPFTINVNNLSISHCHFQNSTTILTIPLGANYQIIINNILVDQSAFIDNSSLFKQQSSISQDSLLLQSVNQATATLKGIIVSKTTLNNIEGFINIFLIQSISVSDVTIKDCILNSSSFFQLNKLTLVNLNVNNNQIYFFSFIKAETKSLSQSQTLQANTVAFSISTIQIQSNSIQYVDSSISDSSIITSLGSFSSIYSKCKLILQDIVIQSNTFVGVYSQSQYFIKIWQFQDVTVQNIQVNDNDSLPLMYLANIDNIITAKVSIKNQKLDTNRMSFKILSIKNAYKSISIDNINAINCNYVESVICIEMRNSQLFSPSTSLSTVTAIINNVSLSQNNLSFIRQLQSNSLISVIAYQSKLDLKISNLLFKDNTFVLPKNIINLDSSLGILIDSMFTTVLIDNSNFINNKYSDLENGLIKAVAADLIISNTTFTNNNFDTAFDVKLIKTVGGIGSLIIMNSLNIQSSTIKNTQAKQGGCFFVTSANSVSINIQNSQIEGCYSEQENGGFMYLNTIQSYSLTISVTQSSFKQTYSIFNGSVFYFLPINTMKLTIDSSTFNSNFGLSGKIVYFSIVNIQGTQQAEIYINQSTFTEDPAIMTTLTKRISVTQILSCSFTNIKCPQCASGNLYIYSDILDINSSEFENNLAANGGSLFLQAIGLTSTPTIKNTQFVQNKVSKNGGAIYIKDVLNLQISKIFLSTNQAYLGGGIYVEDYKFTLSDSQLYNNKAEVGGAIYGNNILPNFILAKYNNLITHNQAIQYGQDYFAYPHYLQLISDKGEKVENNTIIQSSGNKATTLKLVYLDQDKAIIKKLYSYNSNILNPFLVSIIINYSNETTQMKADEINTLMQNENGGVIDFGDSTLTANKINSNQTIQLQSSLLKQIPDIQDYLYTVQVEYRKCIEGEEQSIDSQKFEVCKTCLKGSFSLVSGEACRECPIFEDGSKSVCPGGSEVLLPPGYWRSSYNSYDIFLCDNKEQNCVGNRENDKNVGMQEFYCDVGYIGALCEECDTDAKHWGDKYGNLSNFICGKCSDNKQSISSSVFIALLLILLMIYTIIRSVKLITTTVYFDMFVSCNSIVGGKGRNTLDFTAVYVKMFMHYFSIIVFIFSFNLNLSSNLQSVSKVIANPLQGMIFSLDCTLSSHTNTIPLAYYRFGWTLLIPLFMFLIFIGSCALAKLFKMHRIPLRFFSTCTFCRKLGNDRFLLNNLSLKCFSDEHKYYISSLLIPTLVITVIIIPFALLLLMSKNIKRLKKINVRFAFNLLTIGFKEKFYYWEILKLEIRVLMILIMNIFYSDVAIKGIIVLIINIIYAYVVARLNPYSQGQLNKAEIKVNNIISFSIILGVLLNKCEYDVIKVIVYISLTLVNIYLCYYLIQNIFSFLRKYSFRILSYLRELFPFLKCLINIRQPNPDKINRVWRRLTRYIKRFQFRSHEDKTQTFYTGDQLDPPDISLLTQDKGQNKKYELPPAIHKQALLIQAGIYTSVGNKDMALICKLKSDAINGQQKSANTGFFVPTTIREPKLYANTPKTPHIQQKINDSIRNSKRLNK